MARQLTSCDLVPGDEIVAVADGVSYSGTVVECDCADQMCPMLWLAVPDLPWKPLLTGWNGRLLPGWVSVRITRPFPGVAVL